jgi:hypothetical protein
MIILLNLNVTSVFDTMLHVRLIHNIKKRKISSWFIDWISSFLFSRFTILAMNRNLTEFFVFFRFYISFIMPIYWKCATKWKRTRDFLNTLMMSTFWFTKKASTKTFEISKEYTSSANDEQFDMSSCLLRLSTNRFILSEIRKNSTCRSRSRSTRTRFNRRSIFEFSTCRSTHD